MLFGVVDTKCGVKDGNGSDKEDELKCICGKCVDMFDDVCDSCEFVEIYGITFGCKSSAETVFFFFFIKFCTSILLLNFLHLLNIFFFQKLLAFNKSANLFLITWFRIN